MIYAWHNGIRYGVQFSYERILGHREDTMCDIYALGSDLEDMPDVSDENLMGTGEAYLHDDDNFRAETGRKMALTRALDNAADFEPLLDCKAFRKAIWEAYLSRNVSLEQKQKDDAGRSFDVTC